MTPDEVKTNECSLDEFASDIDDYPDDVFNATVERIYGEIVEGVYEGKEYKKQRFCIELDKTYKDSGDPVVNRYNYRTYDFEAGKWREPSKKSSHAALLAACKICKIYGKKSVGLKNESGKMELNDLVGGNFDWVTREISVGKDATIKVSVPIMWYPEGKNPEA